MMYKIIRSVFFLFDAECVHYFSMNTLCWLCKSRTIRKVLVHIFQPPSSPVTVAGLAFKNPIGLAAGFDKNAQYLQALETLGFGFVEIGTITPIAQAGNEKPRLFRLPKDKAIINRMGFNNAGLEKVKENIEAFRRVSVTESRTMLIGGNIGKNKTTPNELAWRDYEICFEALYNTVDYFVVNVSSPNTPGLRALQEKESLHQILTQLQKKRQAFSTYKPIFLKIAPDLENTQADNIFSLALEIKLDGLIISNTTIKRDGLSSSSHLIESIGAGGLSGKPLQHRAQELLERANKICGKQLSLIGSGGIFCSKDMQERIAAGAHLVQVFTGFIYQGPSIVKQLLKP